MNVGGTGVSVAVGSETRVSVGTAVLVCVETISTGIGLIGLISPDVHNRARKAMTAPIAPTIPSTFPKAERLLMS